MLIPFTALMPDGRRQITMRSLLSLAASCALVLLPTLIPSRAVTARPANDKPWDKLRTKIAELERADAEAKKEQEAEADKARVAMEKQHAIAEQAKPVSDELEQTWYPRLEADERDIQGFNSRCKGQVSPETARSCAAEKAQKDPISANIVQNVKTREEQLKTYRSQWESLRGQIDGYQKQFEALQTRRDDLQKQIEELKELVELAQKCEALDGKVAALEGRGRKVPDAMLEALHNCHSQSWDGAAQREPLGDNPRPPFAATPNEDTSVVDSTGVKKMSDAERQQELSKPGVQRPRPRRRTSPPPPPRP
jgi:peptidoglycan hydrolase CwlO-like protein